MHFVMVACVFKIKVTCVFKNLKYGSLGTIRNKVILNVYKITRGEKE